MEDIEATESFCDVLAGSTGRPRRWEMEDIEATTRRLAKGLADLAVDEAAARARLGERLAVRSATVARVWSDFLTGRKRGDARAILWGLIKAYEAGFLVGTIAGAWDEQD